MTSEFKPARLCLAMVFSVAAVGKLRNLGAFKKSLNAMGVPPRLGSAVAGTVPLIEAAVAIMLIIPRTARAGSFLAFNLLLVFTAVISKSLSSDSRAPCLCFGEGNSVPISLRTLLRNLILLTVSVASFSPLSAKPFSILVPSHHIPAKARNLLLIGALTTAFVGQGLLLIDLLRRYGELSTKLAPFLKEPITHLPIGATAPSFVLTSIRGEEVTLSKLVEAGQPVTLVFLQSGCIHCEALYPRLADGQIGHRTAFPIALVFSGDGEAAKKVAAEFSFALVLVGADQSLIDAYGILGTPSAILVTPELKIGSKPVVGADNIITYLQAPLSTQASGNLLDREAQTW